MKNIGWKFLVTVFICVAAFGVSQKEAQAKTKTVAIASIKKNVLSYRKCVDTHEILPNAEWENLVGTGSVSKIKLAKNVEYRLLNYDTMKTRKVTAKKFKALINKEGYRCTKQEEDGVVYYACLAVKITVKNGKCVKIAQVYQP